MSSGLGAAAGAGKASGGGGIAPGDLAPYGEAGLSVALSVPPERLRRRAAEANPFDERLLVPAEAARKLREAVAQLSSLADEVGPAGREAEVRDDLRRCLFRSCLTFLRHVFSAHDLIVV